MKSFVIVAIALQLVAAFPHDPAGSTQLPKISNLPNEALGQLPKGSNSSNSKPQPATPKAPASRPTPVSPKQAGPVGCKILPVDQQWPTDAEWKAALPGVIKRGPQNKEQTRPDWHLSAINPADVQRAVNFTSKYNIRLSIITTGHDFLSRYVRSTLKPHSTVLMLEETTPQADLGFR
jgi:hypothetical protein